MRITHSPYRNGPDFLDGREIALEPNIQAS